MGPKCDDNCSDLALQERNPAGNGRVETTFGFRIEVTEQHKTCFKLGIVNVHSVLICGTDSDERRIVDSDS